MKELKYLNKYLFKYRKLLIWGTVFVIISNLFQIFPAQLVRQAIDMVVEQVQELRQSGAKDATSDFYKSLTLVSVLILVMALLRGFFLYLVRQTIIVMSRHIEFDLKNEIFAHYQQLSLSFYRRNNTGDLMNRISEDVGRVRMYLGPAIMYGLQLITLFIILIPVMFAISTKLTLYALIPLPFLSLSIYLVNNSIERRSERIQRSQSQLSTFVQEAFSGIRVLKAFHREEDSINGFARASEQYKQQSLKLTRVQALFFPLITALIGLSTLLVVYAGSAEVIAGNLTIGHIAEFVIYVNLLTWPVTSLGYTSSLVQRAEASQKRINEFLRTEPEIRSEKQLVRELQGKIAFDNVNFIYPDTGIQALKNLSFTVEPGQSLAIIGTTGSGKSTVANLITRMYDVTSGEIKIDDIPIQDYDLTCLRSQIGYVPQDVFLFSDTIYNNIAFGGTHQLTHEQIEQAARDADVLHNIQRFPQGFETRIGERGITLSGGQKQRVSIARAIVHEPRILILDDALSAVDTKTEHNILNSLKRIMQGRTTIIISHRVSSAKLANRIIVLVDGQIAEQGTHDELMQRNGFYRDLYEKQVRAEVASSTG
ncbi:MAG: ABC transporter ATP-binding protein/permease [Cyclobacteriaceae bacterium]|nr:ABC transporter ATP-binding protein/permease [Cyclobacteriaceae bacterium]MDW8330705.1 ABC transporter ATP-binding protein [Cyclobacteriaceae bacterium]